MCRRSQHRKSERCLVRGVSLNRHEGEGLLVGLRRQSCLSYTRQTSTIQIDQLRRRQDVRGRETQGSAATCLKRDGISRLRGSIVREPAGRCVTSQVREQYLLSSEERFQLISPCDEPRVPLPLSLGHGRL